MQQKSSRIVWFVMLALIAGCKRAEAPKPATSSAQSSPAQAAAPAAAQPTQVAGVAVAVAIPRPAEPKVDWRALLEKQGPPSLITIAEANGRCEWSVLEPPEIEGRTFLVTHVCPSSVVWDRHGGRSLFVLEGVPYLHDWKGAHVEELAPPPLGQAEYGFSVAGAILACEYSTAVHPDGYDAAYRTTLERQQDGSWKKIGYESFGQDGRTVPCSDSLEDEKPGEMDYDPRYQSSVPCASKYRPANAQCPSQAILESVTARLAGHYAGIEYIAFSERSFLAFPIEGGYDEIRLAPVLSIEGDAITQIYNRQPQQPITGVLLGKDYFLVRAVPEGTHATLFKKGEAEPLKEFPDATVVIWIPGTLPAAEVIEVVPETSGDEG